MTKKLLLIMLFISTLYSITLVAKITPNEVYSEVMILEDEIYNLMDYFEVEYDKNKIIDKVNTELKPRNIWQKSYEVMIKINILRNKHNFLTIEPVNMAPVLNLNPDLVYEQTQRIKTELDIFKHRLGISNIKYEKDYKFKNKTPLDVYNGLSNLSNLFDILSKGELTLSYVFAENMRIYNDIDLILGYFDIEDKTIPQKKNIDATPTGTFNIGLKILEKIKQLQISVGIDFVNFNSFKKKTQTPSEVFGITQMIISELQTIKAYLGISVITSGAVEYKTKTPVEVDQLMSWNLRKLELLKSLLRR
ncbi:MAG: hypothetical protein U9Q30_06640 [Campylobacterota bacterium]|nr:hypothetical protein [Campylobacterota bacterium]